MMRQAQSISGSRSLDHEAKLMPGICMNGGTSALPTLLCPESGVVFRPLRCVFFFFFDMRFPRPMICSRWFHQ